MNNYMPTSWTKEVMFVNTELRLFVYQAMISHLNAWCGAKSLDSKYE